MNSQKCRTPSVIYPLIFNSGALANMETTSVCSSLNGSINDSISRSLNGSVGGGSMFNLDHIINTPSKLPLELQGVDFNCVLGRKVKKGLVNYFSFSFRHTKLFQI